MKILAVDTALGACSAAVLEWDEIISSQPAPSTASPGSRPGSRSPSPTSLRSAGEERSGLAVQFPPPPKVGEVPSEHFASEAEGAGRARIHPTRDNETVLAHCFEAMERGHVERLALMVRETMEDAGLAFDALDRLAVTIGPGTFTGQRVGYAFMRSLRLALARPLIGVTTLATMAADALAETGAEAACVLHDAKRGEVYAYAERCGAVLVPVQLAKLEDATAALLDSTELVCASVAFAGTAAAAAAQSWRELGRNAVETNILSPDALWVARLALCSPEPDSIPRPLYLRPPDARLPTG